MAQTVQLKRSSVASKVPTTSDLALGELALNTYDGRLFFKKDPGTASIVTVATTDDTQTLTNKTLSAATLTGSLTAGGGTGSSGQVLTSSGSGVYWSSVSGGSGLTASSYVCTARLNNDQTVTSNSDALINFIDQDDPQGWWDPTSKRFTPNVAGYYEVSFAGWWDTASTTSGQTNIQMRKNGNTIGIAQDPLNAVTGQTQVMTKAVYMNGSTDYLDFTAYTNNTTSQVLKFGTTGGSGTYFTAHLIAAGGSTTNLTTSADGTSFTIISDTGTDAIITAANSTVAGVMTTGAQTFAGTKTFSNTIVGSINGNAATATALQTARNINGVTFDGTANITVTAATPNNLTIGSGLSGTSFNGSSAVTIAIDSTVATLTGAQTLTNKTLTSPAITGGTINNAVIGGVTAAAGTFTTLAGTTSVTTPSVTNAGTLALAATGANVITAATNGAERMRITSAGRVGIGTTTPAQALTVNGRITKTSSSSQILIYVRPDGSDTNDGFTNNSAGAVLTIERAIDVANSLTDTVVVIVITTGASFTANRSIINKQIRFSSDGNTTLAISWGASLYLYNSSVHFSFNFSGTMAGMPATITLNTPVAFYSMSGMNTISGGGFYTTNFEVGANDQVFIVRGGPWLRPEGNAYGAEGGETHVTMSFRSAFTNPNNFTNFRFDAADNDSFMNLTQVYLHAPSLPSFVQMSKYAKFVSTNGAETHFGNSFNFSGVDAQLYVTSNNALRIGTNNAERLRIHASGGVSIGNTTDPGATNLSVTGNVSFSTATSGTWNGSVITGTYGGTGVNNGARTITIGGNVSTANTFTTAGNFALTLTSTAATNVTLPTTGTLATLAGTETFTNKTLTSPVISGNTAFSANVLFVDTANSRIGVGTATPGYDIHIVDAVAPIIQLEETSIGNTFIGQDANAFFIRRGTIGSADAVTINSNGSVGISNTVPAHSLSVNGTSYFGDNIMIAPSKTISANGSFGTTGQVLTTDGTTAYWSTLPSNATNLTLSANSSTVTVLSDTGADAVILAANSTTAGVITADTQTIGGAKTFANDTSFSANVAITGTVTSGTWNGVVRSRVVSYTDATSITINADTTDIATMVNTQATGTFTINAPTGSLFNGQKLMFRLKSTNVQTFSWNAVFGGSTDAPLPTASSGSSLTDYLGFIYDSTANKWHVIAKNFGY